MKTHQEVIKDNKVNGRFNFRVRVSERRKGFFVLHPTGPIDTMTSPILNNKVDRVLELEPEIILFDMKQVDYINTQGLRVILKVQKAMKRRDGRVTLMNFQSHIEKVFDIIGALPKQRIFTDRHELDDYLGTIQNIYSDYNYITKSETDIYII